VDRYTSFQLDDDPSQSTLPVSLLIDCEFTISDLSVDRGAEAPMRKTYLTGLRNCEMRRINESDLAGITGY